MLKTATEINLFPLFSYNWYNLQVQVGLKYRKLFHNAGVLLKDLTLAHKFYLLICLHRIPDGKAPRFPKKPTIKQDGDILVMECVLEANPVPDITWYQGTKVISDSNRVRMSRKATGKDTYLLTLEISNPTKEDGGNYRCNAFNNFGESNANIALNFQGMLISDREEQAGKYPLCSHLMLRVYLPNYFYCVPSPTIINMICVS
jgi:hypothetical protein